MKINFLDLAGAAIIVLIWSFFPESILNGAKEIHKFTGIIEVQIQSRITMLKSLISNFGKDTVNSMTKYPSILTLHKLGERGRLTQELTTSIQGEQMFATEKIDGTNVRILISGNEFVIGSREFLLHHKEDLFYDPAQGIVENILNLVRIPHNPGALIVVYGELYGGKVSSNSKQYGQERHGFRVFDLAVFENPWDILKKPIDEISRWREHETENGMVYGQSFVNRDHLKEWCDWFDFEMVPSIEFNLDDLSHQNILDKLKQSIPETVVALTETAGKRPEGLVLRNENRTKIVKLRFEDYERSLSIK